MSLPLLALLALLTTPIVGAAPPPLADPVAHRLPIRSTLLTPGTVTPHRVEHPQLAQPLCILGNDTRSLTWLARNANRLRELGATCFLTVVESADDLRRAGRAAQGVAIVPASADQLAQRYGLTHYPVLIGREWIEQ